MRVDIKPRIEENPSFGCLAAWRSVRSAALSKAGLELRDCKERDSASVNKRSHSPRSGTGAKLALAACSLNDRGDSRVECLKRPVGHPTEGVAPRIAGLDKCVDANATSEFRLIDQEPAV